MAASRCCDQEPVFRHQTTGDTVCLAHAQQLCDTCGDMPIEHCHLIGCGQWACLDPLIELCLRQAFVTPNPQTH